MKSRMTGSSTPFSEPRDLGRGQAADNAVRIAASLSCTRIAPQELDAAPIQQAAIRALAEQASRQPPQHGPGTDVRPHKQQLIALGPQPEVVRAHRPLAGDVEHQRIANVSLEE